MILDGINPHWNVSLRAVFLASSFENAFISDILSLQAQFSIGVVVVLCNV